MKCPVCRTITYVERDPMDLAVAITRLRTDYDLLSMISTLQSVRRGLQEPPLLSPDVSTGRPNVILQPTVPEDDDVTEVVPYRPRPVLSTLENVRVRVYETLDLEEDSLANLPDLGKNSSKILKRYSLSHYKDISFDANQGNKSDSSSNSSLSSSSGSSQEKRKKKKHKKAKKQKNRERSVAKKQYFYLIIAYIGIVTSFFIADVAITKDYSSDSDVSSDSDFQESPKERNVKGRRSFKNEPEELGAPKKIKSRGFKMFQSYQSMAAKKKPQREVAIIIICSCNFSHSLYRVQFFL